MSGCKTGDLTASLDSESSKMLRQLGPWVKHVRECYVGEYVVFAPAEGGNGDMMVGRRNGNPVFMVSGGTTTVFDSSGRRVVFEATQGQGAYVSYATHDRATDSWIDNVDLGGNGTVDYRTTQTASGQMKKEISVDQHWLEVVQRGDRTGVILDGDFMTAAVAREKVAAKRTAEAGK